MTDEFEDYYLFKIEQNISEKKIQKAEEFLSIIEKNNNSSLATYEKAKISYLKKDFETCIALCRQLLGRNKYNPLVWNLYGHALFALGMISEALEAFTHVEDAIETPRSKFMIGLCYFFLNSKEVALSYLRESLEMDKKTFTRMLLNLNKEIGFMPDDKLLAILEDILL